MDFSAVCRMCLGNKLLSPIFPNSVDHQKYSMTIFVTTGIKVIQNDGLPQQMCAHCVYNLNNSLKFRKQCKDSELKLRQEINMNRGIKDEVIDESMDNRHCIEVHKDVKTALECEADDTVTTEQEIPAKVTKAESETDDESDVRDEARDQDDPLHLPPTQAQTEDKNSNARVQCSVCQKDLSVRSLSGHMANMHPGTDGSREKCELCDRYLVRDKMSRHMILMHGSSEFKCRYCGATFEEHAALLDHVTRCTVKQNLTKKNRNCSRELVECEVCRKKMLRSSLRIHVRIKHAGLGPVCEHCGRRLGNRRRLEEHLRARHGQDKLQCSRCEFTSASRTSLNNHERRHRGEKPYVCETCGAKFHAPYLLAQHRQSHRTERTVKCDICDAAFKTSNSLRAHRQCCHPRGAAPHRCPLCARAYRCRHYAVKHMRSVHQFKGPVPALQVVNTSSGT